MTIDLSGKKILVTGASRGIGYAIAQALLESGASVGIHFSSSKEEAQSLADQFQNGKPLQADLSKPEQVKSLFENFVDTFQGIDVLVNNAGIAIPSQSDGPDQQWLEHWERTMKININHLAYLCKMAIGEFEKAGSGKIINISSRAALRGDTPDYMAYAASKGAVMSLTRSIARGFGKKNIVAFDVAPGFTRTDMAQEFIDKYGEAYALDDIALNSMTTPEDIAPLIVFLASGKADHATGNTFHVNAGSYVH